MKIIEAIPNFSEGKNEEIIKQIVSPFNVPNILFCSYEMDSNYHRTVVTIIGDIDAVIDGLLEATIIACKLIDLNHHQGVHLRIGATDVIPLVPLQNVTKEEVILKSYYLGEEIFKKTNIPIYYYGYSALSQANVLLPNIRKGEFEGLQAKMKIFPPDLGKNVHPLAGATVIGCRDILVAFNVELKSNELVKAKRIAKKIRESSGGIVGIQAMGVYITSHDHVQVTCNLNKLNVTSVYKAFTAIKNEAEKENIAIDFSEVIGLIPYFAIERSLLEANYIPTRDKEDIANFCKLLKIKDFSLNKVIDVHIK